MEFIRMEFIIDNIDKTRHFDVRNKTREYIADTLYVCPSGKMHAFTCTLKKR